jgi:hypothetical protein
VKPGEIKLRLQALQLQLNIRDMIRNIESLVDKKSCEYQSMLIACLKEVDNFLGIKENGMETYEDLRALSPDEIVGITCKQLSKMVKGYVE